MYDNETSPSSENSNAFHETADVVRGPHLDQLHDVRVPQVGEQRRLALERRSYLGCYGCYAPRTCAKFFFRNWPPTKEPLKHSEKEEEWKF